jgi:DNA-binding transcriptional ArsR family regulator/ribosomal protein L40E
MTNSTPTESALEAAAGAAGPHTVEAFKLLGNETRLAILLALWEAYDPHATDNIVSFSEIFDRVNYDDPGSFSYHLQQLAGQFIRQYADGEGYELRVPALRFIHAVIAGAGVQNETLEPTEIDQPCPFCDAPTAISYEEGLVIHVCTECEGVTTEENVPGYLSAVPFDPAGLSGRTPEEIRAASRVAAWGQTKFMFDGLCPACSGPVERWLECCTDHDQNGICERCGTKFSVLARFQCRTCKNHNVSSPKALVLFHPAVTAFYEEHNISTRAHAEDIESVRRVFDLMDAHEVDVVTENPPRAEVTVTSSGEEIRLVFDDTASVAEVHR